MKIVVTGSTGHISKPLITALAKKGHAIVVISSNPQRVPEITKLGAMPAIGSIEDVQFLINSTASAQVLGKAIGKPGLTWKVLPAEKVWQSLMENGMSKNAAANLVELGTAIHTGMLREDYQKQQPAFGTLRLEGFASEFASAYNQQT